MERADPCGVDHLGAELGLALLQLASDAHAQLLSRSVVERDGEDAVRRSTLLDQPAEAFGRGEGLAGSRSGRDEKCTTGAGMSCRCLFCAESHSGGAPPYGQIAAWGQLPKRVTQVPGRLRGAGSKCPAFMPAMACSTTVRLRSRSSVVSAFSRYPFSPAVGPTLNMS